MSDCRRSPFGGAIVTTRTVTPVKKWPTLQRTAPDSLEHWTPKLGTPSPVSATIRHHTVAMPTLGAARRPADPDDVPSGRYWICTPPLRPPRARSGTCHQPPHLTWSTDRPLWPSAPRPRRCLPATGHAWAPLREEGHHWLHFVPASPPAAKSSTCSLSPDASNHTPGSAPSTIDPNAFIDDDGTPQHLPRAGCFEAGSG